MSIKKNHVFKHSQGYALPLAILFGLITMTIMTASLVESMSSRDSARLRQESTASQIVTDSAIARVLTELSKPENSELLALNYDPINPNTGINYLGLDGMTNTGDETATPLDQWSGYNPSAAPCYQEQGRGAPQLNLNGSLGTSGEYTILAYRYKPIDKIGRVLVEGRHQGISSYLLITLSIDQDFKNFPGIGLIQPDEGWNTGVLALRGRDLLGKNGNVYLITSDSEPGITGSAIAEDVDRPTFLSAIWSSGSDGAVGDTVSGRITACNLQINIPNGIKGTNFGTIENSKTLKGVGGNSTTLYQLEDINLGGNEILTIDTTNGPVVIDMIHSGILENEIITLKDNAKILNLRTDGQPPQVGDARILIRSNDLVTLYDQTCMQNVFLYSPRDELRLLTTGPGCPSNLNTNFEGVVWTEAILSSKNHLNNRNVEYLGAVGQNYDTTVTTGATSGIAVPDDVSSLADLLKFAKLPRTYRYGEILGWQPVTID